MKEAFHIFSLLEREATRRVAERRYTNAEMEVGGENFVVRRVRVEDSGNTITFGVGKNETAFIIFTDGGNEVYSTLHTFSDGKKNYVVIVARDFSKEKQKFTNEVMSLIDSSMMYSNTNGYLFTVYAPFDIFAVKEDEQ